MRDLGDCGDDGVLESLVTVAFEIVFVFVEVRGVPLGTETGDSADPSQ